jgi:diaminopimelate decarboxylase
VGRERLAAVISTSPWWVRDGLGISDGRLTIAGQDADELARRHGTPLFVYDRARFGESARRFQAAFQSAGLPVRLRFALKANPLPEVLEVFRDLAPAGSAESVGIDACSPGEVLRALECGWQPFEISYTGTNVSERDLDVLLAHGIHLNLDGISQVERYGRRAPGTRIGLRIDPATGAGYNAHLEYSGARPTKFGIYPDRVDDAAAAAARHGLPIDTVHVHAGSGWLGDGLASFEAALGPVVAIARRLIGDGQPIRELNVGGGLGVPARANERPIDPDAYAAAIARRIAGLDITIGCEPGDYIAKDTAILLAEQNAAMALGVAGRAYVLETGRVTLEGTGADLLDDEAVRRNYLGT